MSVVLDYSADQRATWRLLYRRQCDALLDRAHPTWFEGLAAFGIDDHVPDLSDLSRRIEKRVGWRVAAVDGQVDGRTFNRLLRDHVMPSTTYVRTLDELAHSPEPDMFHDLFGHLPWLIDPDYRAFLSGFGAASLELMDVPGADRRLGLAFKWSIEYGLIAYDGEIRACGAGLMSSAGELAHALGPDVRRLRFDPALASTTHHVPAQLQPRYFVLDSFAALHDQLPDLIRCATAPEPS